VQRDPSPAFLAIASRAGVDSAAMHQCLRTGATRPLVLSDARLASGWAVEGTPTVLVTAPGPVALPLRVVGELTPARIRAAVEAATPRATPAPTALAVVGQWAVDSIAVYRWQGASSPAADSAEQATRRAVAGTLAALRAGQLRIETEFEATQRFTHRIVRQGAVTFSERGAWAVPALTGVLHVMREDGQEGTYHLSRLLGGDATTLVLDRTFVEGASRGLGERVFLSRAASAGAPRVDLTGSR
jgi:hypothetical protein